MNEEGGGNFLKLLVHGCGGETIGGEARGGDGSRWE